MSEAADVLELQRLDSSADRLHARRADLPERAALEASEAELGALGQQREEARARQEELAREERRDDALVTDLDARMREVEDTLYSGKVTVPRELEALQHELQAFKERQSRLEDEELAVMEQLEQVAAELAEIEARRATLETRVGELRAAIATAEQEIEAELARIREARDAIVEKLPSALLATYEKLRTIARLGGRVVAQLEGVMCRGCRVTLPTAEVSRIHREAREVPGQCPSCGRILVFAPGGGAG
jgi:predicted  nucleic acid-binding Zn-ribbon protein